MPSVIRVSHRGISTFVPASNGQPKTTKWQRRDFTEYELIEMHGLGQVPPPLMEAARQAVQDLLRREGVGRFHSLKLKEFRNGND